MSVEIYKKLYYCTKLKTISDFLFYIYILIEMICRDNICTTLKKYISVLNFICMKYTFVFRDEEICFYIDYNKNLSGITAGYMGLFLEEDNFEYSIVKKSEFKQKILFCKKVSRTRKKGRINRYKIILMSFDSSGTWFGIGKAKDYYLYNALSKARSSSLRNIFFIYDKGEASNRVIYFIKGRTIFSLRNTIRNSMPSSVLLFRSAFNALKKADLSIKKINTINISKLLKLLF